MDSNNNISDDFKEGYIRAIRDIFLVLIENMDDEVKEPLFNELKLKEYE